MEWLVDYANKYWRSIHIDHDDCSRCIKALGFLTEHSGVDSLSLATAFKDPAAPLDTVTIEGHRPGEVRVFLVKNFSNEPASFNGRPSQENVDRLSQIMGKQPRWWVDYEDPSWYDDDDLLSKSSSNLKVMRSRLR
jgi:hypothetical protein